MRNRRILYTSALLRAVATGMLAVLLGLHLAPNFPVAAIVFLLREGLVEMDVPTRQSYVMVVVRPDECTVASGVTHLVRLGGRALGGRVLMGSVALGSPLLVGAGMKIGCDLLLYGAFRRVRPPEEEPAL